jgi:hypothetical protein
VAHACNASYSGDRDQGDRNSKPAWVNSLQDPISKKPPQKRACQVVHVEGPEFKPQYHKKIVIINKRGIDSNTNI